MRIHKIDEQSMVEYEYLVKKYGAIFNSKKWLDLFDEKVSIYGIFDKGENLIGGFHLYEKKRFGLTICCDAPFTPTTGPFFKLESKNPVAIMNKWKKVLTKIANFIENRRYHVVSISLDRNVIDTQPFIWMKYKVAPRYTYILDLRKSLVEIRSDMSSERRKNINKGIKDGLIVKQNYDNKLVKSFALNTFTRQGLKVNASYLDKILFDYADETNSFSFVVYEEDIPISVIFCVHDNKSVYYLLGGYSERKKHQGGGALAFWETIKYAKNLGLLNYDFEGSEIQNIEKYFRGFGGSIFPYYRINKARLCLEILLKFSKRELF